MAGKAVFDFSGQTVLVTGGGTGIGAGIAETFARANADVVISGRRREPLEVMASRFPGRISYVVTDVGKDEDRRRALDTLIERHGRLDVLVNNAGNPSRGPFAEQPAQEMADMFGIFMLASTYFIQLALPHLKETQGCVINISSAIARAVPFPPTGFSVYSAAKAGLNQLTRALASELGPQGVRLNAVAPGPTASEVADKAALRNPAPRKFMVDATPLGRLGQPSDIATVVAFLASDAGAWVTGQVIDASGGWNISA
jgi:NAD(P)-dependent dehydrogenase (short-subunit alcohol dehydrogenase family)